MIYHESIGTESDLISRIEGSLTLESVWDQHILLAFRNFHQQYIRKYVKVTSLISDVLMHTETCMTPTQLRWEWTLDAKLAVRTLKWAFTDATFRNDCNPAKLTIPLNSVSGFAIASIRN
jgi:hypothetical protein